MKKKLIPLILALVCAIGCAFGLTACNKDGKTPTLSSLQIEYNGQESNAFDLGDYQLGQKPNPADYTIKAYYTDGNVYELTAADYTFTYLYHEESTCTDTNVPGYYTLKISFENLSVTLNFNVQSAEGQYTLRVTSNSWRYKQQQPTLSVTANGGAQITEGVQYFYVATTSDATAPTEEELANKNQYYFTGTEIITEELTPGTYFLFAEVIGQETLQDGTSNYVKVNVGKGLVSVSQEVRNNFTSYTYDYNDIYFFDGSRQTLADLTNDIKMSNYDMLKGTVAGSSTDEVDVRIEAIEPETELIGSKAHEFKFVSSDPDYEVQNAGFTMNIAVVKRQIAQPNIVFDETNSTATSIKLLLVRATSGTKNGVTIKKRNAEEGSEIETLNGFTEDSQTIIALDTLEEIGNYIYTISLSDSEIETWDNASTIHDSIEIIWRIKEFKIEEDLKWQVYDPFRAEGDRYVQVEDNFIATKYENYDVNPITKIPEDFRCEYSPAKYFNAETDEQITDVDLINEIGNYYAEYEASKITRTDGHYIVTGEKSTIHYTIANGADVTGKTTTFSEIVMKDSLGNIVTEYDAPQLSEALQEYYGMMSTFDNEGKTAVCDDNEAKTVSGTCDFGDDSFDNLISNDTPWTYSYDVSRENTVEMHDAEGETALEGNLVGNTLTLTMQLPDGYVWEFTFTIVLGCNG